MQSTKMRRRSLTTLTAGRRGEAIFVMLPETLESPVECASACENLRRRISRDGAVAGKIVLLDSDSTEGGSLDSVGTSPTPRHKFDGCTVHHAEDDRRDSADQDVSAIFYPSLDPASVISAKPVSLDQLTAKQIRLEALVDCAQPDEDDILGQAVVLLNARLSAMRQVDDTSSRLTRFGRPAAVVMTLVLRSVVVLFAIRLPGTGSLSEMTCLGRQLRTRAGLILAALGEPTDRPESLAARIAHIERLNLLWLCLNDVIIGLALGALVRDHSDVLASGVEHLVRTYALGYLRELLQWLSSWPMGIKLNDEIASLICRAFTGLSNLWEQACLGPVLAHLPIRLIGWSGVLGASTMFALMADLLAFLTLPYFVCYVAATVTFRHSFSFLRALFDVFRGRKYNPLRHRTEPATYEVDALLLGTILFVMLSSIIPTIAAFYLAFASSRLLLLSLHSLLNAAIALLNAFPLFMLLVRFKSPHKLPGGAELLDCADRTHWPEPHLHLKPLALPYGNILRSLSRVSADLFSLDAVGGRLVSLGTAHVMWNHASARRPHNR